MALLLLIGAVWLLAGGESAPGTAIAFTSRGIWVVPADGGPRVKLSEPYRRSRRTELTPVWSPDATRIAFRGYLERDARSGGAAYHIHVMDADGGGVRNLTRRHFPETGDFDWAPDGERLAVDVWNERVDRHRLHVIRADGGPPRRITAGDDYAPRWSPDGAAIAFSRFGRGGRTGIWAVAPDGTGLRRLARRGNEPAWSPDGSALAYYTGSRPATIHVVGAQGGPPAMLAEVPGEAAALAWSPDGSALAYQSYRRSSGWDVHLLDVESGRRRLLAAGPGDEVNPVWSPDGRVVAYEHSPVGGGVDNYGTYDVYAIGADGSGRRRLTRCRCTSGGSLSWQPAP